MSTTARELPATTAGVLARVREIGELERALAAEKLALAAHYADLNPDASETGAKQPRNGQAAVSWLEQTWDDDLPDDAFIPSMRWDAGAPFAAALRTSTAAGERFVRDALVLRHRLPLTWRRIRNGEVEGWRGRRIAEAVFCQPQDVSEYVDREVAPAADRIGPTGLTKVIDAAMLRLHCEQVELERYELLDRTHVTLDERSINHTGVAEMTIRGDWADLHDFDRTVAAVAAALRDRARGAGEDPEALDVRRARAVGILADPETALRLLAGDPTAPTAPRRRVELVVHVTPDHLADSRDPVVRVVTGGERAALVDQVRSWCGNPAAAVTVLPLLDLAGHQSSTSYETPGRLRRQTEHLAHGHCTFPWCTRPAARCDRDHAIPHDEGGRTCSCNLHPLCRRHHRFKTEAGWRVRAVEPGAWHWTDPFEHRYRRDESGTRELEPPSPVPEGRVGSSAGPSAGRSAGGMAVLVSSSGCFRSPTPAWATPPNTLRVPV